MKKLFTLFVAFAASTCMLFAESGTCGENLTWDLTNGVLTIIGNGPMTNYASESSAPWYFHKDSIETLVLSNGVTTIGDRAFSFCSCLTSVEIPNSVESIGDRAFRYCTGITSVTIGDSVTTIGDRAFQYCSSLTSVEIPNSVISIVSCAFEFCDNLASVTIGNRVTSIGNQAFARCYKLTSITIPASVTQIGTSAFKNGNRLQTITLGSGIETIGDNAFADCPYIITIHAYMEYPPVINANVFANCGDLSLIDCYVPEESMTLYKKTNVWKQFNLKGETTPEPESTPVNCTINYVDKDGALVSSEQMTFHVPDAPVIDGFTFLRWEFVGGTMSDGLTIQAVYKADEPSSAPAVFTNPSNPAQKLIRNGNVYILHGDHTYTLTGQEVR